MFRMSSVALLVLLAVAACAGPQAAAPDAAEDDAALPDAAVADTSLPDAMATDGGPLIDAASEVDASDAAPTDDASDDAAADASDDASELLDAGELDAGDAAPTDDAGPSDGGILRTEDPPTHPAVPPIAPFVECTVTTSSDMIGGAEHRVPCERIDYPYLPPSSGPHYSQWAAFQTYAAPVPWGFLVHAMEHGAVVLAYHCETDSDCDPVRAELASIVADRGLDPVCRDEDTPQRIIIVPDPTLTVPIAATAWGHVYTATCLDPPSLRAFIDAHYAMAPENFCFPGVELSATGWCP